jgi:hypothetical protein
MVIVEGQGQLFEVVGALHACGGLANLLHSGKEKANENGNDGNDDEELDQRETTTAMGQARRVHRH